MPEKTAERKETKPVIDFQQIFESKLASIEPLTPQEAEWESRGLEDIGVNSVIRQAPCVILYPDPMKNDAEKNYDIWVEDAKNCSFDYPHEDVQETFKKFQKQQGGGIAKPGRSAYVIEDNQKRLYLLFGTKAAEFTKQDLDYADERKLWEGLMLRYHFSKLIGQFPYQKRWVEDGVDHGEFGSNFVNIFDKDIVGRIRENSYLMHFADKYGMTNTQFMRFRLRAISARDVALSDKESAERGTGYLLDLDTLAKDVIAQDREEGSL